MPIRYRKAIERQQELVAANPTDVRLLQKLGELFHKAGEMESAAGIFARAATQHGRDGFFLKAVVLMKQVLTLNSKLVTEREDLAGWYLALSMNAEAIAEYRIVLGHYRVLEAADGAARIMGALTRLGARIDPGSNRV